MAKRPWEDITGIPDGWEPLPSNHPGPSPKPPRPAPPPRPPAPPRPAESRLYEGPPDPPPNASESQLKRVGERTRYDLVRLWNQAGNRTSDLSLGALIGGIENGVLRGISSTAWWLLYTGQPRPISQRYEEKLPGPADIVLELQSAMDALNGRLHRPVPRDYAAGVLRTLQWVRGTPDVPRPVPKLDHELADGDWVGVRTARDVRAVADRHREAVSEVDAFDEWGSGVEHTLRWALGTFVSAPMAVAAIGEDPPDRARLQTEARSAAGPPDARPGGEPVPYVRGVQAGLAWLLDPAARTPLPSS